MTGKFLGEIGRFLLGLLLVVSVVWTLVSPSFESVITGLTATAGITASYDRLRDYQNWGRVALIVATFMSLVWVFSHPGWESIASLLVSAIGVVASFSQDFENWKFSPFGAMPKHIGVSVSLAPLRLLAWLSWIVVWYICLYWGFGSFIPGVLPSVTESGAPMPQYWFVQNSLGFIIWIGLTGLAVAWLIGFIDVDAPYTGVVQTGGLAVLIGIVNAWMSFIVFMAHGWNLGDMIIALLVIIFTHIILIGFFASIGMAIFGVGVVIVWTSVMLLSVWVTELIGARGSGGSDY